MYKENEIEVISSLTTQLQELKAENKFIKDKNLELEAENLKFKTDEEKNRTYCEETKRIKKKISKIYIFGTITLIILIAIVIFFFIVKQFILFVLSLVLGMPIFFLTIIFMLIKLYRDLNKIKGFIIKKLVRNYIIARFIYPSRKIEEVAFIVSSKEIKYKGGIYLIDEKGIYFNLDKEPYIDFYIGIPNCLLYNYNEYIKEYNTKKQELVNNPESFSFTVFDSNNNVMDVAYSSETLQEFKKDKLFSELHKSSMESIMSWITLGLIFVVIIFLIIIVTRK